MKDKLLLLLSRKFIIAIIALIAACVAFFKGMLSGGEFVTALSAICAVFSFGNAWSHSRDNNIKPPQEGE